MRGEPAAHPARRHELQSCGSHPAKGWINFSVAAKRMLRLPASAVASISAPSALQRPEKPMPTS